MIIKNEQGFILPVTIAISFLFFLVFTFQVNAYMTEKAFAKETEEIYKLENLMQLGIADVKMKLQDVVESVESTGSITYPAGTILYTITPQNQVSSQIIISCTTKELRKYSLRFNYHYETKEITNLIELR